MLLHALLVVALAQPQASPAEPPAPVDTAAVVRRAIDAQQRFIDRWRSEWIDSEEERRPPSLTATYVRQRIGDPPGGIELPFRVGPGWSDRIRAVHCHPSDDGRVVPVPNRIASANTDQGHCPGWLRNIGPRLPDESVAIDSALNPGKRARIAAARWRLLATLDSASRLLVGHPVLTGQRVRFLVDAGATDSALAVARACEARAATCAQLAGYVLAHRGDTWAAESSFDAARAAMSPEERCAWDDVSALLDEAGAKAYGARSCAARDSANRRLWWVTQPMFVEGANERRVEHYARRVHVELHSVGGRAERHDWRPTHAGDALAAMYQRYGAPSYVYWGGGRHDIDHSGYLRYRGFPAGAPYGAPEYRPGRLHLVPAWRAVAEPTRARPEDWTLTGGIYDRPGTWWPVEHYARRDGEIVAIPEGQTALLRRAQGALLAVATTVPPRARGARREGVLVVSWDPASFLQSARAEPGADGRLVLAGPAGAQPALVGVELPTGGGAPAARLRFGVTPPPPLVALGAGEAAVSAPILFEAPDGTAQAPSDPDAVIARMLPTTTLRGAKRVGVYWESYGLAPTDTVDVEIRVERADGPGAVRRALDAVGLADAGDGSLAIRWREPRPDRVVQLVEAPRPVVARSVVLDLSRVPAGRYWLSVAVGRPGAAPARERREITVD